MWYAVLKAVMPFKTTERHKNSPKVMLNKLLIKENGKIKVFY